MAWTKERQQIEMTVVDFNDDYINKNDDDDDDTIKLEKKQAHQCEKKAEFDK